MGEFAKFRSDKEKPKEDLSTKDVCVDAIKEHIIANTGISNNALIALVANSSKERTIDEDYVQELEFFGYISEGNITEKGKLFINQEDVVEKLRKMIGY
jgi:hypothetical protein